MALCFSNKRGVEMIRVLSSSIESRAVKLASGEFTVRTQDAALVMRGKYAENLTEFKLSLGDGEDAYPIGDYELGAGSLAVDVNGRLALARSLKLVPVAASRKAA